MFDYNEYRKVQIDKEPFHHEPDLHEIVDGPLSGHFIEVPESVGQFVQVFNKDDIFWYERSIQETENWQQGVRLTGRKKILQHIPDAEVGVVVHAQKELQKQRENVLRSAEKDIGLSRVSSAELVYEMNRRRAVQNINL